MRDTKDQSAVYKKWIGEYIIAATDENYREAIGCLVASIGV